MPEEIFDIVDEQDQVIGQAPRAEVHARQLRHRAIHFLLFNSHRKLLVQKRSPTKDTFPNCYDSSASGHLDRGEDYLAGALREIREELGLTLPADLLQKHFKLDAGPDTGWEFVWVFGAQGDFMVSPHPGEITAVTYMNRAEIEELISQHPESCARSFRRIIREVIACGLFPA